MIGIDDDSKCNIESNISLIAAIHVFKDLLFMYSIIDVNKSFITH